METLGMATLRKTIKKTKFDHTRNEENIREE